MTKVATLLASNFLIAALALCLSSCASFYAQQANVSAQIDHWLENHQYDKALSTISALSPEHPEYESLSQLVNWITLQRQLYIQQRLYAAAEFETTQDWIGAQNVLNEALEKLPNAPELTAQWQYYDQLRQDRMRKDRAATLIAQARYLITSRPFQESLLYNNRNRFSAQNQFNDFLQQANVTSRELYVLGRRYWQEGKYVQAREALLLSIETAPNELSEDLLKEIRAIELSQRELQRQQQKTQAEEYFDDLTKLFYQRLADNDFRGAQQLLNEMQAAELGNTEALTQQYQEQKIQKVESLVVSGNQLYNSGYLNEAIVRWQQALALSPEDVSIQQRIERAETFLSNLERWREEEP